MEYPSKLIENAVEQISKLPGVGKRSALRYVLYLLKEDKTETQDLCASLLQMRNEVKKCKICYSLSDTEVCSICSQEKRNHNQICVVENVRDVMAIENTHQYNGVYHVLGSVISPIDGIGIDDITAKELEQRVKEGNIEEIIFALPTTMEGDTTSFYLNKILSPYNVKISIIARGIAIGDNIEFADEVTLSRSLLNRMPFNQINNM